MHSKERERGWNSSRISSSSSSRSRSLYNSAWCQCSYVSVRRESSELHKFNRIITTQSERKGKKFFFLFVMRGSHDSGNPGNHDDDDDDDNNDNDG